MAQCQGNPKYSTTRSIELMNKFSNVTASKTKFKTQSRLYTNRELLRKKLMTPILSMDAAIRDPGIHLLKDACDLCNGNGNVLMKQLEDTTEMEIGKLSHLLEIEQ